MSRATAPQSATPQHELAPGAPAAQLPPPAATMPTTMPAPAQRMLWPPAFRWLVVWAFVSVLAAGRSLRLVSWLAVLAFPREEALVFVAILLGLGQAAASAVMAMVAESAPGGRRAVAFAVTGAVESLAALAVPLAIGFLADAYGLRAALSGAALMGAIWLSTGFEMGLMRPVRPLYALAGLELAMLALILVGAGQAWPGFGRGLVHDD